MKISVKIDKGGFLIIHPESRPSAKFRNKNNAESAENKAKTVKQSDFKRQTPVWYSGLIHKKVFFLCIIYNVEYL